MTFSYIAYGLNCVSNVPIPGFYPSFVDSSCIDLAFTIGSAPDWVCYAKGLAAHPCYAKPFRFDAADSSYTLTALGSEDFFKLAYSDGAEFIIDGPCERVWTACSSHPTDYLATYLRGPVMGFILRRRGVTALHASALSIDGRAVVVCGESGAGKSTAAAAFALMGVPVMCEDIAPLASNENQMYVAPGYPQIGLWPDGVQNLFGSADALPRWTSAWEKRFLALDGKGAKFESQKRPCGAIYVLSPRTNETNAPRVEEITQRQAILELLQNTYMNWILNSKQRAAEFEFLSRLVTQVSVRRLVPHQDPKRIGALCDLVIADYSEVIGRREAAKLVPTE